MSEFAIYNSLTFIVHYWTAKVSNPLCMYEPKFKSISSHYLLATYVTSRCNRPSGYSGLISLKSMNRFLDWYTLSDSPVAMYLRSSAIFITTASEVIACSGSSRTALKIIHFNFQQQIETDLSHDGLNSAHVPLLIGEQPNLSNLFQLEVAMSQHRGAKQSHRYGLSEVISLLSLTYLLFVDR